MTTPERRRGVRSDSGADGATNSDATMRSAPFGLDIRNARCNSNRWVIVRLTTYTYI